MRCCQPRVELPWCGGCSSLRSELRAARSPQIPFDEDGTASVVTVITPLAGSASFHIRDSIFMCKFMITAGSEERTAFLLFLML